jgi:hypothetical protein
VRNKKLQKKHGRDPLIAFVTSPRTVIFDFARRLGKSRGGEVARQQLKIDGGKFAPDAVLNGRAKKRLDKGSCAIIINTSNNLLRST